jgi:signal recognition particle subunit SRP54
MPGMPGAGLGGRRKPAKGKKAKSKGARSGNPAKRALEAQQASTVAEPTATPDFELPTDFTDLLPPSGR